MDDDTVEWLQTKIAYLEKANLELSDVVFRQQRELEALGRQLREVAGRLDAAQVDERSRTSEDERPPHY